MTRPFILLACTSLVFLFLNHTVGYESSYRIGYGAFTLMAAMISLTFLWLWARRATPLAMGMSLGWAGAASVMGWWWSYSMLHHPEWMVDHPILLFFLSVYFVGAVLHFQVIGCSFGAPDESFLIPVGACLLLSVALHLLT